MFYFTYKLINNGILSHSLFHVPYSAARPNSPESTTSCSIIACTAKYTGTGSFYLEYGLQEHYTVFYNDVFRIFFI